jgi:hypothetical protein
LSSTQPIHPSIHPSRCVFWRLSHRSSWQLLPSNFWSTATRHSLRVRSNAPSSKTPKPGASLQRLQSRMPPSTNRASASPDTSPHSRLPARPSARMCVKLVMWPRLPRGTSPTVPTMVSLQPLESVQVRPQTRPARRVSRQSLRQPPQPQQEAQAARKPQAHLIMPKLTTIGKLLRPFSDQYD